MPLIKTSMMGSVKFAEFSHLPAIACQCWRNGRTLHRPFSKMSTSTTKFWLLKAEPDTRIVKGKNVQFSVDDFERVGTSPWEGVRNYEARNLMKEMAVGEKALFYHSNCKTPGIAAFAQVSKAAYPDYTSWDASHPYYDPKSNSDDPKWFMVDLTFTSRAKHFIPLALLRYISDLSPQVLPKELAYLGDHGIKAIKGMDLVTRGRLSVQRVGEDAWAAIELMAENGGWEELNMKPKKKGVKVKGSISNVDKSEKGEKSRTTKSGKVNPQEETHDKEDKSKDDQAHIANTSIKRKRGTAYTGVDIDDTGEGQGLRRSNRAKK